MLRAPPLLRLSPRLLRPRRATVIAMASAQEARLPAAPKAKPAAKPAPSEGALLGLSPLLRPLDAVFDMVRDKTVVLFGEASHGTQEFYSFRCDVSKRLIQEAGCMAVCIEGDFPETSSLHRFVMGSSSVSDVDAALEPFKNRFPVWMWRNQPTRAFLSWLREHNAALPCEKRAGIFGLDLYSLQLAMTCVIDYLTEHDPRAAAEVKKRFACFDPFMPEPQLYGASVARHHHAGCRAAVLQARTIVVDTLRALSRPQNDIDALDEAFMTEMNARVVVDAEAYYRAMFDWNASSWNVRDKHFDDTLFRVRQHLRATRGDGADRVVVWAHNSHLGDAGATGRAAAGETNLGQLARQSAGRAAVVNVGQFTHTGTVTAAEEWGDVHATRRVRPSLPGSYEAAMHAVAERTGQRIYAVDLRSREAQSVLASDLPMRIERAIGVIYRPDTERQSHYFPARLREQFDVAVWWDTSSALKPLDPPERPTTPELDEFPSGL